MRNVNKDGGALAQDIIHINVQWEKTKMILVDTHESALICMERTRKGWLSDKTYRKIEERQKAKQKLNDAQTRQGKCKANSD